MSRSKLLELLENLGSSRRRRGRFDRQMGADQEGWLVDSTAYHPNRCFLLAGPTIRLSGRHAKVRRDGYRG